MDYLPPTEKEDAIASVIVNSAYAVHHQLGPGLLESIYETCFCYELQKRSVPFYRQMVVPLIYDNIKLDEGLRIDVLVDNLVICELKSVEELNPVHEAQVLSYMKLAKKRLGFLINFNVPVIKNGIKRYIL
jgi:GxxExxY protein